MKSLKAFILLGEYTREHNFTHHPLILGTMNSGVKHAPVLFSIGEGGNSAMTCFFDIEFN